MTEHIEKQAAIEAVKGRFSMPVDNLIVEVIKALPAADVRPVVRGKWEWRHRHRGGFRRVTGEDDFGISHTITVDERYQIEDPYCPFCKKLNESIFLNFCPNCGADLREGEDNTYANTSLISVKN